ncbi:MAG: protein kinase [Gemmataceae bacterium]
MENDRNLRFGALALELGLLNSQQFAEACAGWSVRKDVSLPDLLSERGWIKPEERRRVEELLGPREQAHDSVAGAGAEAALRSTDKSDEMLTTTLVQPVKSFERYTVNRLHAEGGLGRIYVVHDTILNREVALKEIKPKQAAQVEACRRFLREAQVTGQLEHPNIVPVYELSFRKDDQRPYYTMRLLHGQTLRERIADYQRRRRAGQARSVEFGRLLEAFVGICQAIAYAHSRGVIHRDLTPDNNILGEFGEVIVLDWGLAKSVTKPDDSDLDQVALSEEASPMATTTGRILGTPAYMAPEQAEGKTTQINARTDVYGLGAILFELLTGHPPHEGQGSGEVLRQIVTGPTRRVREIDPGADPALEAVCAKAMAKSPRDRYSDAKTLAEEIQRFLADEPVSVYTEPWTRRLARWTRHHRTATLAAAMACLGVIVTSVVAAILLAGYAEEQVQARRSIEKLRAEGLEVACRFAARTIANEIDLRWRILEAEANDPELRRFLGYSLQRPLTEDEQQRLQSWIERRHRTHSSTTKASSWFVTDRQGQQVARSPFAETVGKNWSFRDYFHGLGRDLTPQEASTVAPIADVHRSTVFESQATFHRMVAFSVPIWSADGDQPQVHLGVLAMTVELGRFTSLQLGLSDAQVVVLAETRRDWIEGTARHGLILHHPVLAHIRQAQSRGDDVRMPIYRLPGKLVTALESLRAERLEQSRRLEERPDEPVQRTRFLVPDYQDLIDPKVTWLAAFEPVQVRGRADKIKDTGWIVIVQEKTDWAQRAAESPSGHRPGSELALHGSQGAASTRGRWPGGDRQSGHGSDSRSR